MSGIYASAGGGRAVEQRYRELLEHWPVPHEQLRVPTCQGETFVVTCGPPDAPPVVLLHGTGASSAMWMADAPAWAQHFRVHAIDLIGEPGLSAPSRPPLASDGHARWLDDVLAALDVERAAFVGVSLGGWLALDYATRRPERVNRMALLCPSGIGRQQWGVVIAALLLLPFGRWRKRTMLRLASGSTSPTATPQARELAEYMMFIHQHFKPRRVKVPVFGDDALRGLTMPMLVIVGGRDIFLDSYGTRRRLEGAAPHAQVNLLPAAGHFLHGQTLPILDFLRATDSTVSMDSTVSR